MALETRYASPAKARVFEARRVLRHFGGDVDKARNALECSHPGLAPAYIDAALDAALGLQ